MNAARSTRSLAPRQSLARLAAIGGISGTMIVLRAVDPQSVSWFPLRSSCGALTGLPCIFCGTTRAVHHLLNGDFARALYLNWLSFPLVIAAAVILFVFAVEAFAGRRVTKVRLSFGVTPQRAAAAAFAITALWLIQVILAVGWHKQELLNPAGLLYAYLIG